MLHEPSERIGFYYMPVVLGVTLGSFVASRMTRRFGLRALALTGNWIQILGATALLVVDLGGSLSATSIVTCAVVFAAGSGFANSNLVAGALGADPQAIGAASGLYGFQQMMYGGLCTLVVGLWHSDSALPVAVSLLASGLLGKWAIGHARKARTGKMNDNPLAGDT